MGYLRGLLASLLLAGCSAITVSHDWDVAADLDGYRTWAWLPGSPTPTGDPRIDNPLVQSRVRIAVEEALGARGLARTSESNADCLVAFHAAIARVTELVLSEAHRYRYSEVSARTDSFDEGSLIVDIIDGRTRQLVWRGIAKRAVDEQASPVERTERIREAVERLFERFPPEAEPGS